MEPFYLKNNTFQQIAVRGYTLLELLVVLAIIGILAAVVIVGQGQFNSSTLLTDTTYTVALSIRETQTQGLSSTAFGSNNNAGYGIHFSSPTSYIQFADILPVAPGSSAYNCQGHTDLVTTNPDSRPGNCLYDSLAELVRQYSFTNGYTISKIWYYRPLFGWNNFVPSSIKALDIVYERPNTSASMIVDISGSYVPVTQAVIDITSPQGGTRCVALTPYGEIYESSTLAVCAP